MDVAQALKKIQGSQHPSGGWSLQAGEPSSELSALCLLALRAASGPVATIQRGDEWLASIQCADGGWPPYPGIDQSTWLTALAVFELGLNSAYNDDRGIAWLVERRGQESTFVFRLRTTLLGGTQLVEDGVAGWPWYPGTAAWVSPTSYSLLALGAAQRRKPRPEIAERIEQGRRYLRVRTCHDGGWNHGSSQALGYDSDSYPETTGLALAALQGCECSEIAAGLAAAKKHLARCRSLNGLAWLSLGLLSHGEEVPADVLDRAPCRDTSDLAMFILTSAALAGNNLIRL